MARFRLLVLFALCLPAAPAPLLLPGVAWAEEAPERPEMAAIEQAWARGDFVFVRQGLKRHAEETGTALAQYRYGRVLLEGRGGPRDPSGAQHWLEQAVAQNHAEAAVLLARLYLSAMPGGPARDPVRAAALFKSAAARGNAEAQYYLGLLYGNGTGVEADPTEAFTWLLAAAENAHVDAAFELSRAYSRGAGTAENTAEALRWLQTAAEAGHAEAQFYLAYALDSGQGAVRNRPAALNWLMRSAEAGFLQARIALGKKYLTGDGVQANPAEAVRWLSDVVEAGDPGAMASLGAAYLGRHGVAADLPRALLLLRRASDAGLARASFDLAGAFEQGHITGSPDLAQAVSYYRRAVEQGSPAAAEHLGRMAGAGQLEGLLAPHHVVPWALAASKAGDTGAEDWLRLRAEAGLRPAQTAYALWLIGQDRDPEGAAALLLLAAEAGDTEAQYQLGRLHVQGAGVAQDYVAAHKWLNIAAAGGSAEALDTRSVVADLMTPEQLAEAQRAARAFFDSARAPDASAAVGQD
ncbi:tetratricopeptide repeat protein [Phaeobacter sp. PT47_59]|uniref:tetratricopeptide repeat protein n=1 Tax=Phaeobacter sp. PT47_59 TaxID=3029979 RepID=UPI00237FEAB8|nr:tetratricopeptide repeat protein [Phaeobacter sp. PT47_59]MDE4175212.1 tetratricopeptide repeat protein [Phaeobacter sp. PT47_59]